MIVAQSLKDLPPSLKPSVATIGVFDGVHRGHQALLKRVTDRAAEKSATPVVVTFDRHPLELLAPGKEPAQITTLRQRADVLSGLGIGALIVLEFNDALRHLEPDEFVRQVLVDALGVVHVVIGSNFRFGYQHAGTIETLRELGTRYGFGVDEFSLVGGDEAVSSTMIRRRLADGEVERVAEELGRPFRLEGVVEKGAGRGKGLGVPTANVRVAPKLALPKIGVYAGWVTHKGNRMPAVINVGLNPTFEERATPVVEAHILDFDGDLYGEVVSVEFTHRLRDELKFTEVDDLIKAMQADVEEARSLLGLA